MKSSNEKGGRGKSKVSKGHGRRPAAPDPVLPAMSEARTKLAEAQRAFHEFVREGFKTWTVRAVAAFDQKLAAARDELQAALRTYKATPSAALMRSIVRPATQAFLDVLGGREAQTGCEAFEAEVQRRKSELDLLRRAVNRPAR
jgi:hypothetical protein